MSSTHPENDLYCVCLETSVRKLGITSRNEKKKKIDKMKKILSKLILYKNSGGILIKSTIYLF